MMANRVGERVGNYNLVQHIGVGGFADVYLGENINIRAKKAAVKILFKQLASTKQLEFESEANTIATLDHPNIVRLLDYGIHYNQTLTATAIPYIVMDYAPYGNLRLRHAKGTSLDLLTIASYVIPLASALQYAHDSQIIHRDVKPENILIGQSQQLLLSDFGLAVVMPDKTIDVTGTLNYIAPEQINGHPVFASDQYSLGIMVYEWMCGHVPFTGNDVREIVFKHISATPPSLQVQVPGLSAEVEAVVMRALEKEPGSRYSSVSEFASELQRTIGGNAGVPPGGSPFGNSPGGAPFGYTPPGSPFGNSPGGAPFGNSPGGSPFSPPGQAAIDHGSITRRIEPDPGVTQVISDAITKQIQDVVNPRRGALRRDIPFQLAGVSANLFGAILIGVWVGQMLPTAGNDNAYWSFLIAAVLSITAFYGFFIARNKVFDIVVSGLLAFYWGLVGMAVATLIGSGSRLTALPTPNVVFFFFFVVSLILHLAIILKRKR